MKRLHIHIGVESLDEGIQFYSALFGADPVKVKVDYAKWMLDDPCVNLAISTRARVGVEHLGIQVDDDDELAVLRSRLSNAGQPLFDEGETVCCYAQSEKSWVKDPAGVAWEAYRTMDDAQLFHGVVGVTEPACCTAENQGTPGCCVPSEKTVGCCD